MESKLNGYGVILRFITPVLISIVIFMVGWLRTDILELKVHFTNHLSNYNIHCLALENRLSTLETTIKRLK